MDKLQNSSNDLDRNGTRYFERIMTLPESELEESILDSNYNSILEGKKSLLKNTYLSKSNTETQTIKTTKNLKTEGINLESTLFDNDIRQNNLNLNMINIPPGILLDNTQACLDDLTMNETLFNSKILDNFLAESNAETPGLNRWKPIILKNLNAENSDNNKDNNVNALLNQENSIGNIKKLPDNAHNILKTINNEKIRSTIEAIQMKKFNIKNYESSPLKKSNDFENSLINAIEGNFMFDKNETTLTTKQVKLIEVNQSLKKDNEIQEEQNRLQRQQNEILIENEKLKSPIKSKKTSFNQTMPTIQSRNEDNKAMSLTQVISPNNHITLGTKQDSSSFTYNNIKDGILLKSRDLSLNSSHIRKESTDSYAKAGNSFIKTLSSNNITINDTLKHKLSQTLKQPSTNRDYSREQTEGRLDSKNQSNLVETSPLDYQDKTLSMNNELNGEEYQNTKHPITKYRNSENNQFNSFNKKDPIYKVLKGEPIKHRASEHYTLVQRSSTGTNQTLPNYKNNTISTSEAIKKSRRSLYNQSRANTNSNAQFQLKTESSLRALTPNKDIEQTISRRANMSKILLTKKSLKFDTITKFLHDILFDF